jgi:FkbM family methyltransferase
MNAWLTEDETGVKHRASVNVWPAGISDTAGTQQFFESYGHSGLGRFGNIGHAEHNRTDYQELPVRTLDMFAEQRGWFESQPDIQILKIDVERQEANVLVGAEKLLRAGIVQNIFTVVSLMDPERRDIDMKALELLVSAGYKLAGQGGWAGPGKHSSWRDDANLVKNIFDHLENKKKLDLNLWWTL